MVLAVAWSTEQNTAAMAESQLRFDTLQELENFVSDLSGGPWVVETKEKTFGTSEGKLVQVYV